MDVAELRRATAQDHEAVEGAVPLMGAELDRERYCLVMERMYGVVSAWEEYAGRNAPAWLAPYLEQRQRRALLQQDLLVLGCAREGLRPRMPELAGEAELLGAMYVMEGSRLGGQLIARHVEGQLGLERGRGNAYFLGYGERTGAMWKEFLDLLRERVPDAAAERTISGAKEMFRVFGEWMRTDVRQYGLAAGDVKGFQEGR